MLQLNYSIDKLDLLKYIFQEGVTCVISGNGREHVVVFQSEFNCLKNLPVEDPCFSVLDKSQPQTSHLPAMQRHFSPSTLHVDFHSAIGTAKESSPNLSAPFLLSVLCWGLAGKGENERKKPSSQVLQLRMEFQQLYSVSWGGLCALGGGEAVAFKGAAVSWRRFPSLGSLGKCWVSY